MSVGLIGRDVVPAWFDVHNLKELMFVGANGDVRQDEEEIRQSFYDIQDLIKKELDSGIERIAVGGVSQGAAMAIYTAINSEVPLKSVFAISGWIPLHHKLAPLVDAVTPESFPPIMLAHSAKDPIVDIKYGRKAKELLKKWGLKVKWREFPSEGHGVPDLYWQEVLAYLSET